MSIPPLGIGILSLGVFDRPLVCYDPLLGELIPSHVVSIPSLGEYILPRVEVNQTLGANTPPVGVFILIVLT